MNMGMGVGEAPGGPPLAIVTHGGVRVTHLGGVVTYGRLLEGYPRDFSVEWITNPITEINQENCEVRVYFDPAVNLNDRYHLYINGDAGQFKYRTGLCTAPIGNMVVGNIDCSGFANGAVSAYLNLEDTVTGEGRMYGPENVLKISRIPIYTFDPEDYVIGTDLNDTDGNWTADTVGDQRGEIIIGEQFGENYLAQVGGTAYKEYQLLNQNFDPNDCAIGFKVYDRTGTAATFQIGLDGPLVNTGLGLGVRQQGTSIALWDRNNGVFTNQRNYVASTLAPGDTILLVITGGEASVYHNGSRILGPYSMASRDIDDAIPKMWPVASNGGICRSYAIWDLTEPPPI
jgi:hypothetical protein